MYDAGLYDPDEEEDEGFYDFVQEMVSLMDQTRREDKNYSIEELQSMLLEMAKGFESPTWFCGPSVGEDSGCSNSKRRRWQTNPMPRRGSHLHTSGLEMFGSSGYCN
ncbi:hypothetical protein FH972_020855 [Carpinus fangiana]|uniref:Uncharacterized protein n=1 Tax=Carpinus fangiana TaxID=176857 RepID=A0A5N6RXP8_9ROSI|nr:hypothetical protein FH972_020855 [Carpinus fangiana]